MPRAPRRKPPANQNAPLSRLPMQPREAMERALGWAEAMERISVKGGVAEPRRKTDPMCVSDAEAYNMLKHLQGLV